MRLTAILVTIFLYGPLQAQQTIDTLYANEKKNVALFFPDAIRQGITGAPHFVFTYNREKEQYFGLLQAQPGEESNLLIVTDNGQVYSYILKYAKTLPKLNYFVPEDESIGNEMPVKVIPKPSEKKLDNVVRRLEYFRHFGDYLLKPNVKKASSFSCSRLPIMVLKPIS